MRSRIAGRRPGSSCRSCIRGPRRTRGYRRRCRPHPQRRQFPRTRQRPRRPHRRPRRHCSPKNLPARPRRRKSRPGRRRSCLPCRPPRRGTYHPCRRGRCRRRPSRLRPPFLRLRHRERWCGGFHSSSPKPARTTMQPRLGTSCRASSKHLFGRWPRRLPWAEGSRRPRAGGVQWCFP